MTQEEALREADALVSKALHETETRCTVLAEFISNCERNRVRSAASSEAHRELRALHDHRRGLLRRHSLIQQALDCPVGQSPTEMPLPPPSNRTVSRIQQQIQVQVQPRARRRG
jgi:hypothetical protein